MFNSFGYKLGIKSNAKNDNKCTMKYGGKLSNALYRKWRPQTFDELFGQEHIKKTLKNAVLKNKIVHAYLFSGPRGSGKTTSARIIAKAINCMERDGSNPCNKCSVCISITKGNNLDFIEIDAASNRGIEDIKDLREKVKFAPSALKKKVFVIDEAHMLTKEAFNALLKTLEEPPKDVIFILATTEVHKIPATIISRCQRYDFRRLSIPDLSKRLSYIAKKEKIKISGGALDLIAKAAYGSARDAESLLDLIMARGYSDIKQEDVEEILGKTDSDKIAALYQFIIRNDAQGALSLVNEISEEGKDIMQFSQNFIEYLRTKMLQSPKKELASFIKILSFAQKEMKTAILPQLPLEIAVMEIINEKPGNEDQRIEQKKIEKPANNSQKSMPCKIDWNEVVLKIKPHNHSLCFLLKSSEPIEICDNKLILGVDYKFHKDKLEENENRKIIEKVLKQITGDDLRVFCKVIKKAGPRPQNDEEKLIDNVNNIFNEGLDGKDI